MRHLLLSLILIGIPSSVPATAGETPLALAGTWLRDEAASDDVEEKARDSAAASSNWGARGPGVTFGRGGGRGGQGGRGGRGSGGGDDRYRRLARGLQVWQIEEQGGLLTIRDANRETRVVFLDGRTSGDGLASRTTARKEGDTLVIETRTEGTQMIETFRLAGDGRLVVDTEIQSGGGRGGQSRAAGGSGRPGAGQSARARAVSLEFRTVYERIDDQVGEGAGEKPSTAAEGVATAADSPPETDVAKVLPPRHRGSVIRILPPPRAPGELLTGKVLMQTLTISPIIEMVEFWLDDERVARRTLPPWEAKVGLADPPHEQTLRVSAWGPGDRHLGDDELVLNRLDPPFRVRITSIDGRADAGAVKVSAEVSVPRKAELEKVSFFRGEDLVAELREAPFVSEVAIHNASPTEFVRVLASLRDGRELEDVQLIQGFEFSERIDVHLVQLQVLVTDRSGAPLTDLEPSDFEIVDGGQSRKVERLYPSRDVALVLGLAIDSSGSMGPIWPQTQRAAQKFLEDTLEARDRAFLVDFDTQLRLLQSVTGDKELLYAAMSRLQPQGGTALYDSMLFSLLQYEDEPGRRALIVVTDGFDSASQADPKRAIEFGQRLGVPVYVIAMSQRRGGTPMTGAGGRGGAAGRVMAEGTARNNLRLITGPTGGRLFQVVTFDQVEHAFDQIQTELRSQYVLTYYTERAPGEGDRPKVKMLRKGAKVKTAVPLVD